jgi:hypothetical protein
MRKAPKPMAVRTAPVWFPGRKSPDSPWRRTKGAPAGRSRRVTPAIPLESPARTTQHAAQGQGEEDPGEHSAHLRHRQEKEGRHQRRSRQQPGKDPARGSPLHLHPEGGQGRDLANPEEGEEREEEGDPAPHREPRRQGEGADAGARIEGEEPGEHPGKPELEAHPEEHAQERPQRAQGQGLEEVGPEDGGLPGPQAPEHGNGRDPFPHVHVHRACDADPSQEEGHEPHEPQEAGQAAEALGQRLRLGPGRLDVDALPPKLLPQAPGLGLRIHRIGHLDKGPELGQAPESQEARSLQRRQGEEERGAHDGLDPQVHGEPADGPGHHHPKLPQSERIAHAHAQLLQDPGIGHHRRLAPEALPRARRHALGNAGEGVGVVHGVELEETRARGRGEGRRQRDRLRHLEAPVPETSQNRLHRVGKRRAGLDAEIPPQELPGLGPHPLGGVLLKAVEPRQRPHPQRDGPHEDPDAAKSCPALPRREAGGEEPDHRRASSRTRPPSMRRTRSVRSASERSWVTRTRVVRASRFSSSSRATIFAPVSRSRFPVGSSAKRTPGRVTKARARATRCCSPPESWEG